MPEQERQKRRELLLPKWTIPLVWAAIILLIMGLLPWIVARMGRLYGWAQGLPGWWNLAGLLVVAAGLAMYAWCLVFHFKSYRTSVRVGFSPPHLVTTGPYRVSRNPMYVSGLLAWVGWTFLYGSPAVLAALTLLWAVFSFRVIPFEERQLETQFGDEYLDFKRTVPRWIGRFE